MNKKILIIGILISVIIGGGFIIFSLKNRQISNKQSKQISLSENKILKSLEEKFEFCEFIKNDINKKEAWLICNERPFFLTYNDEKINYDFNGWDWIRKTDAWNDLEKCDFYNSDKSGENYNLTFYCPRDFNSEKLTAITYSFDVNKLEIKKLKENNFLDVIDKGIKNSYQFLTECNVKGFNSEPDWDPPALFIKYLCEDGEWNITILGSTYLFPPVFLNKNISLTERAKISFEKTFGCEAKNIEKQGSSVIIKSDCGQNKLEINYSFSQNPYASYQLECREPCLSLGKYFVLLTLTENENAYFIGKMTDSIPEIFIYKSGNRIIKLGLHGNKIITYSLKPEGFYYGIYYE